MIYKWLEVIMTLQALYQAKLRVAFLLVFPVWQGQAACQYRNHPAAGPQCHTHINTSRLTARLVTATSITCWLVYAHTCTRSIAKARRIVIKTKCKHAYSPFKWLLCTEHAHTQTMNKSIHTLIVFWFTEAASIVNSSMDFFFFFHKIHKQFFHL